PGDHVDQGRLARAVGADQEPQLAPVHGEVDPVERAEAVEDDLQPADLQQRGRRGDAGRGGPGTFRGGGGMSARVHGATASSGSDARRGPGVGVVPGRPGSGRRRCASASAARRAPPATPPGASMMTSTNIRPSRYTQPLGYCSLKVVWAQLSSTPPRTAPASE